MDKIIELCEKYGLLYNKSEYLNRFVIENKACYIINDNMRIGHIFYPLSDIESFFDIIVKDMHRNKQAIINFDEFIRKEYGHFVKEMESASFFHDGYVKYRINHGKFYMKLLPNSYRHMEFTKSFFPYVDISAYHKYMDSSLFFNNVKKTIELGLRNNQNINEFFTKEECDLNYKLEKITKI